MGAESPLIVAHREEITLAGERGQLFLEVTFRPQLSRPSCRATPDRMDMSILPLARPPRVALLHLRNLLQ
jgi:hypothetical protein